LRPLIPLLLDSRVSETATAKRVKLVAGFVEKAAAYITKHGGSGAYKYMVRDYVGNVKRAATTPDTIANLIESVVDVATDIKAPARCKAALRNELIATWKACEAIKK
jgi:hypothetical protein